MSRTLREFGGLLAELGEIYDLLGDQPRAVAYGRASQISAEGLPAGKSISDKWAEYQATGKIAELTALCESPKVIGLRSLMGVLGVGPRLAVQWMGNGIRNISDLQKAVARGDVQLTAMQTLGLRHYTDLNKRITREQARSVYNRVASLIGTLATRIELVGSYRRGLDTVGDVDILVEVDQNSLGQFDQRDKDKLADQQWQKIVEQLEEFPLTGWVMKGKHRLTFLAKCRDEKGVQVVQCDLLIAPRAEWPAALLYFTGSKLFNEHLRLLAKKRGWLLNQHGLFDERHAAIPVTCEKDIFDKLQVEYLPPDKR